MNFTVQTFMNKRLKKSMPTQFQLEIKMKRTSIFNFAISIVLEIQLSRRTPKHFM